jgi:hypothetical protein
VIVWLRRLTLTFSLAFLSASLALTACAPPTFEPSDPPGELTPLATPTEESTPPAIDESAVTPTPEMRADACEIDEANRPAAIASEVPPKSVLWFADHERGDLSEWLDGNGGGPYNSGTGVVAITDQVARSGRYAVKLTITEANGQVQASRLFRYRENPADAFYSAWFCFPERYEPGAWWNIFQFKSAHDGGNDPTWVLNISNRPDGSMFVFLYDWIGNRSYGQNLLDIQVGEWVHLEARLLRSTKNGGRIAVWQDGQLLIDVNRVTTSIDDNIQWSVNNYTGQIVPPDSTIYVDDAVISTTRIGRYLPAGQVHAVGRSR